MCRERSDHPRSRELYYTVSSKSMGKRELLLIVAFVVVGVAVYQGPRRLRAGETGFSFSRMIESVRREVRATAPPRNARSRPSSP